jgi:hypothetical protein
MMEKIQNPLILSKNKSISGHKAISTTTNMTE